jgi:hypothetical protein
MVSLRLRGIWNFLLRTEYLLPYRVEEVSKADVAMETYGMGVWENDDKIAFLAHS